LFVSRDVGPPEKANGPRQGVHDESLLARARILTRDLDLGVRISVVLERLDRDIPGGLFGLSSERRAGLRQSIAQGLKGISRQDTEPGQPHFGDVRRDACSRPG
jgi:hypothetical protein